MRCEGVLPAKERVAISAPPLGCRQVVRHRFLVPAFPGSNPGTPATLSRLFPYMAVSGQVCARRLTNLARLHCSRRVAFERAPDIF